MFISWLKLIPQYCIAHPSSHDFTSLARANERVVERVHMHNIRYRPRAKLDRELLVFC